MSSEVKIAQQIDNRDYEGPFYVYNLERIGQQVDGIKDAFSSYPRFELLYAIKANSNKLVLDYLAQIGLGFHVSTLGEMALASEYSNRVSFTGPILTPSILDFSRNRRVTVNANSLYDLNKIKSFDHLGVRINPGMGWSIHESHTAGGNGSQFGILPEEFSQIPTLVRERVERLHMHTSSDSYETDVFLDSLDVLLDLAKGYSHIDTINLGGGLGTPLRVGDNEFNIHQYANEVIKRVTEFNQENDRDLKLQLEPGSYLTRQSGYYVCRVYSITSRKGKFMYFSDGSSHHLKGKFEGRELLTLGEGKDSVTGQIFGSTCQRGDVLFEEQLMPRLVEGDYIVVPNTGAYCSVQADNLNMIGKPQELVIG